MNRIRARTLKPYEGRKLKRMKHQLVNAVNSRHARIILLSCGGLTNRQIAERCDCSGALGAPDYSSIQPRRPRSNHVVSLLLRRCRSAKILHRGSGTNLRSGPFAAPGTYWHERLVAAEIARVSDRSEHRKDYFAGMVAAGLAAKQD